MTLVKATAKIAAVLSLVACVLCAPCYADLIQNGSFELGKAVSDYTSLAPGAPSADLTGWTVPSNIGEDGIPDARWYIGPNWSEGGSDAQDGDRFLNLCPYKKSFAPYVSQDFSVHAGKTYTVSYWEMNRYPNGPTAQQTVTIGLSAGTATGTGTNIEGSGTNTLVQTADVNTAWTRYAFDFTPTESATATLKISLKDGTFGWTYPADADGTYVDNVHVVPEPGTCCLLGICVLGLLAYAWRRRK